MFKKFAIEGPLLFTPKKFDDHRGFFSETYNSKLFRDEGIFVDFVQDNQSLSVDKGTVRGLHFQAPPYEQAKLVRAVRGSILDVAVDIRIGSKTFGKHVAVRISAEEWNQLYVPAGFAHGFITLERNTEIHYKVSNYYAPEHDYGILWNDPKLEIDWGEDLGETTVSEKDLHQPLLEEILSPFVIDSLQDGSR